VREGSNTNGPIFELSPPRSRCGTGPKPFYSRWGLIWEVHTQTDPPLRQAWQSLRHHYARRIHWPWHGFRVESSSGRQAYWTETVCTRIPTPQEWRDAKRQAALRSAGNLYGNDLSAESGPLHQSGGDGCGTVYKWCATATARELGPIPSHNLEVGAHRRHV